MKYIKIILMTFLAAILLALFVLSISYTLKSKENAKAISKKTNSVTKALKRANCDENCVGFQWNANPISEHIEGYKLYYKKGCVSSPTEGQPCGSPYNGTGATEGDSPVLIPLTTLLDVNNPEFYLGGLGEGHYYFVVTAYNSNGESTYSNEVDTVLPNSNSGDITPPEPTQPPGIPVIQIIHN